MKLGIDKTAMIRVSAGISYALTEAMDEGHCGLPTEELLPLAEELLEVPRDLIRTAIDLELADGTVVADRVGETGPASSSPGCYRAERTIAERLLRWPMARLPGRRSIADKAIAWVEQRTGLTLADSQKRRDPLALRPRCWSSPAGPGVGKTTIVNVDPAHSRRQGRAGSCCAPRPGAPPNA